MNILHCIEQLTASTPLCLFKRASHDFVFCLNALQTRCKLKFWQRCSTHCTCHDKQWSSRGSDRGQQENMTYCNLLEISMIIFEMQHQVAFIRRSQSSHSYMYTFKNQMCLSLIDWSALVWSFWANASQCIRKIIWLFPEVKTIPAVAAGPFVLWGYRWK